jgi:hypothetical protein
VGSHRTQISAFGSHHWFIWFTLALSERKFLLL